MKARHGIQRQAVFHGLQIGCGQAEAGALDHVGRRTLRGLGQARDPALPVRHAFALAVLGARFVFAHDGLHGVGVQLAQPVRKPGDGRQGGKVLQLGQFFQQLLDHALEQEVAEADALQAGLRVGNGIEDGPARLVQILRRQAAVQQHLHVVGHIAGKRHFHEDQRHARHLRMEIGIAAAVGRHAAAQVIP
ncbi:hypothetical protein D3C72_1732020 [compost metagenome]